MKRERAITERDLPRSLHACQRIEDEITRRLRQQGCTASTDAATINAALQTACAECPEWCERPAWERIAQSFAVWAGIFNSLDLFWRLR